MNTTSIILAFVVSSLCGAVFHLIVGGGAGKLILYLILSWIGFSLGHIAASQLGWSFADIGPLHLGTALIGTIAFLGIGYWLSFLQPENEQ